MNGLPPFESFFSFPATSQLTSEVNHEADQILLLYVITKILPILDLVLPFLSSHRLFIAIIEDVFHRF